MAHQLREMHWHGQDEFNTFIEEGTMIQHNSVNDERSEVTEADIETEKADIANLMIEHFLKCEIYMQQFNITKLLKYGVRFFAQQEQVQQELLYGANGKDVKTRVVKSTREQLSS